MNLYDVGTHWVRTQAEAKALGFGQVTDIPTTSKDAMIEWLNSQKKVAASAVLQASADPEPVSAATKTLSRIDNPGLDVDGIVEVIGASKGYALRRYAGAVAVAFKAMEKC